MKPAAHLLNTCSEYLKIAGANVLALFVQNPCAFVLITIAIVVCAVLIDRLVATRFGGKSSRPE